VKKQDAHPPSHGTHEPATGASQDPTNPTPFALCVQITHNRIRALSAALACKDRWNGRGWLQPNWTRPVHVPQSREEPDESTHVKTTKVRAKEETVETGPVVTSA
jgi:hypothetical protein